MQQQDISIRTGAAIGALIVLSACMSVGGGAAMSGYGVSDLNYRDLGAGSDAPSQTGSALAYSSEMGGDALVFKDLLSRRSVLEDGPLAEVALAVLEANSRSAEAELRAARLRSEAEQKNWLPRIGPNLSLSTLSGAVAGVFVEQSLFDNGQRAAERELARADVQVAAVALAEDSNERVRQALELYLRAEAATARANVNAVSIDKMRHFEFVMSERVKGGVSNRADLLLVQQKRNQMESDLAADQDAAFTARAELQAMSARPIEGISGISPILASTVDPTPLAVLRSQAEAARAVATAKAERGGVLPNLTVSASANNRGTDLGLKSGGQGIGFGRSATLAAFEAKADAATANIARDHELSARRIASFDGQIASLARQSQEAKDIAIQAARNYDLFVQQLEAGQRSVPEVVSIFEIKVRAEREAVQLTYDLVRLQLQRAAILGVLVDGERI